MNRNMIPTPLIFLQEKLTEMQRSLMKSVELLEEGVIDGVLHELHKKNLTPRIKEYEQAIKKLLE